VVFDEISLLTGFYWLELYKYEVGLKLRNWHGKRKPVKSAEFRGGSFCVSTLGWPIGCSGVEFWRRLWGRFCRSCSFQAFLVWLISGGPVCGAGLWCRFSAR